MDKSNNIALVNIILSNFAKEAQRLVSIAQTIYDENNNIVINQVDKLNEQWGILKGHCSTLGLAINGYKNDPEPYIHKIELFIKDINNKRSNVNQTPKPSSEDEGLSSLSLIIINLLSVVKISVEDFNEQILGVCVNNQPNTNENENENENENDSLNSLDHVLVDNKNDSRASLNQSSSTLSVLSDSVLQAIDNALEKSNLDDNDNTGSNQVQNNSENNEGKVTINRPNANAISYTPKPLPFGFEEERMKEQSRESTDLKKTENEDVYENRKMDSNDKNYGVEDDYSKNRNDDHKKERIEEGEHRKIDGNDSIISRRKESYDNPTVRRERNVSISSHEIRKKVSLDELRKRRSTEKNDTYPQRYESFEKPPNMKKDRIMCETSITSNNSSFMSNCKANKMRTPSMENVLSAVSEDTIVKSNHDDDDSFTYQRKMSIPTQSINSSKTPKNVNFDPAVRGQKLPSIGSNYEPPITPYTPYSQYSDSDRLRSAVSANSPRLHGRDRPIEHFRQESDPLVSEGCFLKSARPGPASRGREFGKYHCRQESDPIGSDFCPPIKSIKSNSAINAMINNYDSPEGIKKQIDNMYNELYYISKNNENHHFSGSTIPQEDSPNTTLSDPFSSHFYSQSKSYNPGDRKSNISMLSSGFDYSERLSTLGYNQHVKSLDRSVRMNEGMNIGTHLYEDYFNRNSDGQLVDLQMVLVPLNNMFEICTIDLNEPIEFGRSNVNNFDNFMIFRSLVISRTHARIWSEDGKVCIQIFKIK